VGIFYGEPEPIEAEGSGEGEMRRKLKYAVIPAMYDNPELLRVKMPSTRYVLGRDETNASYYDAQVRAPDHGGERGSGRGRDGWEVQLRGTRDDGLSLSC
jgi:hypothetical protein